VDDEANVLSSLRRMLRGHFDVQTAPGGREGLDVIDHDGPFAVVVADMRMPEMDGVEFLSRVKRTAPDTVRIMLTGNADMGTAVAAVNEGHIFRFLTKPCPRDILIMSIEDAAEQNRLITAERELLEQTLKGSVKVLTDVLALVDPTAFGRAGRLKRYVKHMASQLDLTDMWRFEIAAMLSQIGCVTLPAEIIGKLTSGKELSTHEQKMFAAHPATGGKLIANIPRLEAVAEMIARQRDPRHSLQSPAEGASDRNDVAVGAQLLKVALDFDKRVRSGIPPSAAIAQMRGRPDEYDPSIVETLGENGGRSPIFPLFSRESWPGRPCRRAGQQADTASEAFDIAAALQAVDGDEVLLKTLAGLFIEKHAEWLAAIEHALADEDCPQLARTAHSLKGAVGTLGCRGAFEAALSLETMGRQADLTGAERAWQELTRKMAELRSGLGVLLEEHGDAHTHCRG